MLNSENYLEVSGDDEHTETNIDIKNISFMGTRIKTGDLFISQPEDAER